MADEPKFALYVSSVPGRLVSRPGSPHSYIGATLRTPDEVKVGKSDPTWQPDVIVPVLEGEYLRFVREWNALVSGGDLLSRSSEDFAAYTAKLDGAEKVRDAELAKAKAEAEKVEAAAKKKAEADAKASNKSEQGGA
jgi:hypothetical protein